MSNLQNFLKEYKKIAVPDSEIDFSDCPPLTREQLKNARRLYPREQKKESEPFVIRINSTLASHLYESGDDYESKVNDVLMNAYAMGQI